MTWLASTPAASPHASLIALALGNFTAVASFETELKHWRAIVPERSLLHRLERMVAATGRGSTGINDSVTLSTGYV
jgi:hypothetical protein